MIELQVSIEGKKFESIKIKNTLKNFEQNMRRGILAAEILIADKLRRKYLAGGILRMRTGALNRSVKFTQPKRGNLGWYGEVGVGDYAAKYARILNYGGIIRPKFQKYLRFKTPDGSWHSVKEVHIPAFNYMDTAIKDNREAVVKAIERHIYKDLRK